MWQSAALGVILCGKIAGDRGRFVHDLIFSDTWLL